MKSGFAIEAHSSPNRMMVECDREDDGTVKMTVSSANGVPVAVVIFQADRWDDFKRYVPSI